MPDAFLEGLSMEHRTRAWSKIITESAPPASGAFVLEDHGDVLGFAHIAPSRDEDAGEKVGELTAIHVSHEFWGSAGSDLLLERAIAGLRDAGFSEATLWVLDTNVRARRFYASAGWAPDGTTKVDKREGFEVHEVRYRRLSLMTTRIRTSHSTNGPASTVTTSPARRHMHVSACVRKRLGRATPATGSQAA